MPRNTAVLGLEVPSEGVFKFLQMRPPVSDTGNKNTRFTIFENNVLPEPDSLFKKLQTMKASKAPLNNFETEANNYLMTSPSRITSQAQIQALFPSFNSIEAELYAVRKTITTTSLPDLLLKLEKDYAVDTKIIDIYIVHKNMLWDNLIAYSIAGNNILLKSSIERILTLSNFFAKTKIAGIKTEDLWAAITAKHQLPNDIFPLPPKVQELTIEQQAELKRLQDEFDNKQQIIATQKMELKIYKDALAEIKTVLEKQEYQQRASDYQKAMAAKALLATAATATTTTPAEQTPLPLPDFNTQETLNYHPPKILKAELITGLTNETQAVLQEIDIIPEFAEISTIYEKINAKTERLQKAITKPIPTQKQIVINGALFQIEQKDTASIRPVSPIKTTSNFDPPVDDEPYYKRIHSVSVGDLLIVKKKLLNYIPTEIAHVENLMAFEKRERTHRRFTSITDITTKETETTTHSERELESTEQFSMERAASEIQSKDSQLETGLSVSGGYGPVQATVNVGFSSSSSSDSSKDSASSYAKSTTERALEVVTKRVLETRTRIQVSEVEETNLHSFNNTTEAHKVGIYRWLNKKSLFSLYNYGKRVMLEFTVAEPAAWYIWLKFKNIENILEKPVHPSEIDFQAVSSIAGINFTFNDFMDVTPPLSEEFSAVPYLANLYNVQDIEPAPIRVINIEAAFVLNGNAATRTGQAHEIEIPKGYAPISGNIKMMSANREGSSSPSVAIVQISDKTLSYVAGGTSTIPLFSTGIDFEVEEDPYSQTNKFSFSTYIGEVSATAKVRLKCQRTSQALEEWKIKTFNAIMAGYHKQLADYNEKLNNLLMNDELNFGENPLINKQTIEEELKRNCISSLYNNKEFGNILTDAIIASPDFGKSNYFEGLQPDTNRVEAFKNGEIANAYENAFEWGNMTYKFMPYYWADGGGKKGTANSIGSYTLKKLKQLKSGDKNFQDFLQCGMAKVTVPVLPKFTNQVLESLSSGLPLNEVTGIGAPLQNDTYLLALQKEMDESKDSINTNGKLERAWVQTEPTSLVMLATKSTMNALPNNTVDAAGKPIPVVVTNADGTSTFVDVTAY